MMRSVSVDTFVFTSVAEFVGHVVEAVVQQASTSQAFQISSGRHASQVVEPQLADQGERHLKSHRTVMKLGDLAAPQLRSPTQVRRGG